MSDLQVQVIPQTDGVFVVALVGSADIAGAAVLERHFLALSVKHPKHVVFDLAKVPFISSLAMGSLMAFRRGCATTGGRVTLAAVQPQVAGMFKHAGLDKLLPMAESVEAALAAAVETAK